MHGIGKLALGDSSLFDGIKPGFRHVNSAGQPNRMPGMPGLSARTGGLFRVSVTMVTLTRNKPGTARTAGGAMFRYEAVWGWRWPARPASLATGGGPGPGDTFEAAARACSHSAHYPGTVGVGKSTVAAEISDVLTALEVPNAAVDLDALVWQWLLTSEWNSDLMFKNLASLWPNYLAHGATRLVLARVLEDQPAGQPACLSV
jgi:hypothetical protein